MGERRLVVRNAGNDINTSLQTFHTLDSAGFWECKLNLLDT